MFNASQFCQSLIAKKIRPRIAKTHKGQRNPVSQSSFIIQDDLFIIYLLFFKYLDYEPALYYRYKGRIGFDFLTNISIFST